MWARTVVLAALICALCFADLAAAANCPTKEQVAATFAALPTTCKSLTNDQLAQLAVISQFVTSALKATSDMVTVWKVKPEEMGDKLAKVLPDTFLNPLVASLGTSAGGATVATRPTAGPNTVAGVVPPNGVLLETRSSPNLVGGGPEMVNPMANAVLQPPPLGADVATPPLTKPPPNGPAPPPTPGAPGAGGCNDALLKTLAAASCAITGLPLLDQLIGGFAGAFTTSAAALAKLGEWSKMIEAQVTAINKRKDRKPPHYNDDPPAAPTAAPGTRPPTPPPAGVPTTRPPTPRAPVTGRPAGSFLQLRSQSRQKSNPQTFPTLAQGDAAGWVKRMGCNDANAVQDMGVLKTATNGCSVPGGWYLYIGTFTDACQIHDMCYSCPKKVTRKQCDQDLYNNSINLCGDKYCAKYLNAVQRGFCYDVALDYWVAVRGFGGSHAADKDMDFCAKPCPAKMTTFKMVWDGKWC